MKKLFILLTLVLFTFNSFSQKTEMAGYELNKEYTETLINNVSVGYVSGDIELMKDDEGKTEKIVFMSNDRSIHQNKIVNFLIKIRAEYGIWNDVIYMNSSKYYIRDYKNGVEYYILIKQNRTFNTASIKFEISKINKKIHRIR